MTYQDIEERQIPFTLFALCILRRKCNQYEYYNIYCHDS